MKTMTEIRQENLKILSSGFKNQRAFADALEATPGYISQLLIGSCKFGEKAARKIEVLTGKPNGWMDTPHDGAIKITDGFYDAYKSLSAEQQKQIDQYIAFIASQAPEKTPKPENKLLTPMPENAGGGGGEIGKKNPA
ncbi:MAG: hypothetical protein RIQ94_1853 [Pseudomonadota bacterium]